MPATQRHIADLGSLSAPAHGPMRHKLFDDSGTCRTKVPLGLSVTVIDTARLKPGANAFSVILRVVSA